MDITPSSLVDAGSRALVSLGSTTVGAIAEVAKERLAHPDPMSHTASPRMNGIIIYKSPQTVASGMSTTQKVALGVGAVAVFAVGVGAGVAIKTAMDKQKEEAERRRRLLQAVGVTDAYADVRGDMMNSLGRA
ncbi:hypothetical protein QBC47DRAFT_465446 [Echria macrotheca]|uniref:Transmembrane protein n=1 Tax=Echria macrotheca TaxID=438768 RepID=A0AAJ0F185_9PEZI|nr:hypothetical protein QBC47DRAFT_465446 [Echria macrotheca]